MTGSIRPALVLTGGPGAGKTSCGRALAEARTRCAFVDADDLRQLVVSGARAPWEGEEGERQREAGARGSALLASSFAEAGIECVVADVLSPRSLRWWRRLVPDAVVVRLVLDADAALVRLGGRHRFITDDEVRWVHRTQESDPPLVDALLDVAGLSFDEQVGALERIWCGHRRPVALPR